MSNVKFFPRHVLFQVRRSVKSSLGSRRTRSQRESSVCPSCRVTLSMICVVVVLYGSRRKICVRLCHIVSVGLSGEGVVEDEVGCEAEDEL